MYDETLTGKKVKFKFIDEEYKVFYGNRYFEGIIVKNSCKNYIISCMIIDGEIDYDYFELHEVEFELI